MHQMEIEMETDSTLVDLHFRQQATVRTDYPVRVSVHVFFKLTFISAECITIVL